MEVTSFGCKEIRARFIPPGPVLKRCYTAVADLLETKKEYVCYPAQQVDKLTDQTYLL